MPIRLNEDGSLPMYRDTTGRWQPTAESSDLLNGSAAGAHTHPESEVTNLVTDLSGKATTHAHPYAATSHAHVDGDLPAGLARDAEVAAAYSVVGHTHAGSHPDLATHDTLGLATDAELATHAATPHGGQGSEAFPVGSVFLSVVSTNPATLLGYGTWSAFAAGRMLVGLNAGDADFDTAEETGGAKTHTHAAHSGVITHTHTTDSQGAHVHDEYRNSATTGGLDGWAAGDTSTNNATLTGYDTGSAGGHTHTAAAPAGAVAELAHDTPSNVPPYIVVHMWKRTA